jgi:hypothetical protein
LRSELGENKNPPSLNKKLTAKLLLIFWTMLKKHSHKPSENAISALSSQAFSVGSLKPNFNYGNNAVKLELPSREMRTRGTFMPVPTNVTGGIKFRS